MKLRYYLRGIGLGIIVAAAICMCASLRNKQTEMTDAEIKARAKELGMVDSRTTLADASETEDVSIIESPDEGEYVEVSTEEIAIPVAEEVAEEASADESGESSLAAETTKGSDAADAADAGAAEADGTQPDTTASPDTDNSKDDKAVAKDEKAEAKDDKAVAKDEKAEAKDDKAVTTATGDTVTIVVEKGNGSDTVARKLADAGLVANASEYDKYLMANGYDRIIAAGTHKIPKGASNEEIAKLLTSKQD